MNKKVIWNGLLLMLPMLLSNCGGSCEPEPMDIRLSDYHASKQQTSKSFNEGFSAYFDLSDGMAYAYKDETLSDYLQGITNKIDSKWSVYGLATSQIEALNLSKKDLYNKINNEPYTNIKAPIEKSFMQIVADKKLALLISDLEEYEPENKEAKIQYSAYATKYFSEWLNNDGQILFYVMNYDEPINKGKSKKAKHLYFVLFDDLKGTLKGVVDQALAGRKVAYETFLLSNNFYTVETKYSSATKGGNFHDSQNEDLVTAVNEQDTKTDYYINKSENGWEYYPCMETWSNIVSNAKAQSDKEIPKADRFSSLLKGLFVSLKSNDSYIVKNLDIKVYNVNSDFEAYSSNKQAKTCAPSVRRDGEDVYVDMGSDPCTEIYYDPVTGSLLKEYEYAPIAPQSVVEMFDVQCDLQNDGEVIINFSDKFDGSNRNVNDGDLLRIDVCLGDCEINYEKMKDYFVWQDIEKTNKSIEESLRATLQSDGVNPKGKVIYTYYIKTLN